MEAVANPFRGLLPFEEKHAALFFGRDREIQDVAARLESRRLLAVTGVSGSGKSSLVMAGVIPMLRAGLLPKLGPRVHVAILKPRGGPLFVLRQALTEALGREVAAEALARTTYGLVDSVKPLPPDESLIVLVDQFEEIFPYRKDRLSVDGGAEADRFVALLLQAVEQAEIPIYVILTMRSDYLGECAVFRGLPEALNEGHYLVPKMTRHQLQEAIEGPLGVVGVEMHPSVVQRLLNECEEEPDFLPVLQHLLRRMFEAASKGVIQ
jgi:energy-coupling factor transporter ATP-binding protein EcfA2